MPPACALPPRPSLLPAGSGDEEEEEEEESDSETEKEEEEEEDETGVDGKPIFRMGAPVLSECFSW